VVEQHIILKRKSHIAIGLMSEDVLHRYWNSLILNLVQNSEVESEVFLFTVINYELI